MKIISILSSLLLLTGHLLLGQVTYNQLGSDINGIESDNLGTKVASSADGSIMAIGAPGHTPNGTDLYVGQVKVYELINNEWVQKGSNLNGESANDSFGTSLDISDDGTVLVVGAPNSDASSGANSFAGKVSIYEWNGTDWVTLQTLEGTAIQENFGNVLSISANGDFVAVGVAGSAGGGSGRGAVRVFERSAAIWSQVGTDINGVQDFETSGTAVSIAITATDKVVAVGAPMYSSVQGNNDESGQLRIYRESAGSWGGSWAAPETITGDLNAALGAAVDFSVDGSRIVVGAPNGFFFGEPNYAEVYEFNASATPKWQLVGNRINSNLTYGDFGKGVGLAGDGSHVLVGAPTAVEAGKDKGYIKLYKFESTDWTELDSIPGVAADDQFGFAVTINTDGSRYAVGAPSNDAGGDAAGQVQAYKLFIPDVIQPTVAITSGEATYTNVNPFPITITFSEEVTGFDASDITVANATVTNLATNNNVVFTADITPPQDGNYSISIAADALTDIAGNGNEASNSFDFTFDSQAPTSDTELLITNNNRPVLIGTVDDATATISIIISGTTLGALSATNNGDGTWELTDGSITSDIPDGIYDVVITAEDQAGNSTEITKGGALTIDTSAPVLTIDALSTNNPQPTLTGTITETTTGISNINVTVNNNTVSATLGQNNTWTASISSDLAENTYSVSVTALDNANNEATLTEIDILKVDLTKPTVFIQNVSGNVGKEPFVVTFAFSEVVSGFEAADITVTNSSATAFTTIDPQTYSVEITATDALEKGSDITISIAADAFQDLAGNSSGNAVSATTIFTYKYSGGKGTEADPYLIDNEADLREISNSPEDYSAYFKQTSTIEVGPEIITPIGNSSNPFAGNYDGQGFSITGITNVGIVNIRFGNYTGSALFGDLNNAVLKNIGIKALAINTTNNMNFLAGLVVYAGSTTIENCYVIGSINSNIPLSNLGGLAAKTDDAVISQSFTDISIEEYNPYAVGGLIGSAQSNTVVRNSYSLSNLTILAPSQTDVIDNIYGGLIGEVLQGNSGASTVVVENSYYAGEIATETIDIGGLVAKVKSGSLEVTGSFWDKDLSGLDKTAQGKGTGLTTFDIKLYIPFTNYGWSISDKSANDESTIWKYDFLGNPYLNWQDDKFEPFTIKGKVINEKNEPFEGATISLSQGMGANEVKNSAATDAQGNFSIVSPSVGFHSITVNPNNSSYEITYLGDTKVPLFTRQIYYDKNVTIQMVPVTGDTNLDGAGRLKGNIVTNAGTTQISQGRILEGDPLAGVSISLLRESDKEILITVETNENGVYEIEGIPAGKYQLLLNLPGIDVNLEGSTFDMDEQGTPLIISATVSENGVLFTVEEEVLGIKDQIEVSVYPNPVRDFINIQVPGKATARVFDMKGTLMIEESFVDIIKLNISTLHNNMYILEISNAEGRALKKLVKK